MTIATVGAMAVEIGISLYVKSQAADYESKVAQNNAKLAEIQRGQVMQAGAEQAANIRAEGVRVGAAGLTAAAANGVETTTGSVGNIFAVGAANAAMDAKRAKTQSEQQAWALANEAQDTLAMSRMRRQASILGGIGESFGAAGSLMSTGYQMYKTRGV
jgi:hypothetical protein